VKRWQLVNFEPVNANANATATATTTKPQDYYFSDVSYVIRILCTL